MLLKESCATAALVQLRKEPINTLTEYFQWVKDCCEEGDGKELPTMAKYRFYELFFLS